MSLYRSLIGGAILAALAVTLVSTPVHAGPPAKRVSRALDTVASDIYSLRDVRGPFRRDAEIQRLRGRLDRLENRSARQPSRRARRNERAIRRLRDDLWRIEQRNNRRISRLQEDAYYPEPEPYYIEPAPGLQVEIAQDAIRLGIQR